MKIIIKIYHWAMSRSKKMDFEFLLWISFKLFVVDRNVEQCQSSCQTSADIWKRQRIWIRCVLTLFDLVLLPNTAFPPVFQFERFSFPLDFSYKCYKNDVEYSEGDRIIGTASVPQYISWCVATTEANILDVYGGNKRKFKCNTRWNQISEWW